VLGLPAPLNGPEALAMESTEFLVNQQLAMVLAAGDVVVLVINHHEYHSLVQLE
jgi:hypothetical protein